MLGLFLEFLLIMILVAVCTNLVYPTDISNLASSFNVNPSWKGLLLASAHKMLCFDSIGVTKLNLLNLSLGDIYTISFWFISGLLFGARHKKFKDSAILGFITPLAVAQLYIMMLQQYTPDLWASLSPTVQQQLSSLAYFNGLQLGVILTAGLLVSTSINKIRLRKPKVEYVIPEEEKVPIKIKCPSCGKVQYSNAKFCSYCGAPLTPKNQSIYTEEKLVQSQ